MKKGTHSLFPCMLGMVILCVIFTGCTLARIKEPLTMIGTYFDTVIQLQVWDADEEILNIVRICAGNMKISSVQRLNPVILEGLTRQRENLSVYPVKPQS